MFKNHSLAPYSSCAHVQSTNNIPNLSMIAGVQPHAYAHGLVHIFYNDGDDDDADNNQQCLLKHLTSRKSCLPICLLPFRAKWSKLLTKSKEKTANSIH